MDPELILREVPGKSVQWPAHPKRLNRRRLCSTSLDPPRSKVIGMGRTPVCLRPCSARDAARIRRAGALPFCDPRIRTEPLPAEATRTTAKRRRHGSPYCTGRPGGLRPPARRADRRARSARRSRLQWSTSGEQTRVTSPERQRRRTRRGGRTKREAVGEVDGREVEGRGDKENAETEMAKGEVAAARTRSKFGSNESGDEEGPRSWPRRRLKLEPMENITSPLPLTPRLAAGTTE